MKNEDRIERAIEGLLSDEEWQALQADIVRDPELRAAYVDRIWLHSNLRAERETLVDLLDAPEVKAEGKVVRRWPVAWIAAAAACLVLIAGAAVFGRGVLFQRPVATLVQAENCKWAGSDLPTAVNSKYKSTPLPSRGIGP